MEHLYFVAVLPDLIIRNEITEYKYLAKEKFGSSKALNSPPHITLVPPFFCEIAKQNEISESLKEILKNTRKFYITINGFNRFDKKVIYADVENNSELIELKKKVKTKLLQIVPNLKVSDKRFRPHITIAFRDLQGQAFYDAWQYFSGIEYFRVFRINNITLLKHTGSKWEIVF